MATKLQHLLLAACERVECNKTIDEDLLIAVSNEIAQAITKASANELAAKKAYKRFSRSIQAACMARTQKDDSARDPLSLGALWGVALLVKAFSDEDGKNEQELIRKEVIAKYNNLFTLVMANPGITHGELAEGIGKTKGRLTQIVSDVSDLNLLIYHMMGRNKHYYLSNEAKDLMGKSVGFIVPDMASTAIRKEEYVDFDYIAIAFGRASMKKDDYRRLLLNLQKNRSQSGARLVGLLIEEQMEKPNSEGAYNNYILAYSSNHALKSLREREQVV